MASQKQIEAARRNIRKAREVWQNMSPEDRARAQPEGRRRVKPGRTGKGDYFHVEVRNKYEFELFRTQDVGSPGGIQRVTGRRTDGSWDTLKWLIGKDLAHVAQGRLVPDSDYVRELLQQLGNEPVHVKGDIFRARP